MRCRDKSNRNKGLVIVASVIMAILTLVIIPGSTGANDNVGTRAVDDNIIVWEANSTHYINKKLEIATDETLIIEPGVKVYFSYGGPSNGNPYSLRIKGKLLAIGEPDNPILFTSNTTNPAADDWDKIKFHSSADDSSIMENCIVEYSIQGVQVDRCSVTIRNNIIRNIGKYGIKVCGASSPLIENNTINSRNIGIRMIEEKGQGTPNPIIRDNVFENNSYYAILVDSGSGTVISNNIIRKSGEYGIYSTVANPVIEENRFEDNRIGVVFKNSRGLLRNNVISGSKECGIYITYGEDLIIKDNTIEDNVFGIIAENSFGTVENNEFKGNQTKSIEMTDCNLTLTNNIHNGLVSSFKHIVLQAVNSDGYPIKGTTMTIDDTSGTTVTSKELGESSTLLLGLENYDIDHSGIVTSYTPYKVTVEKDGVKSVTSIDDITVSLHQLTLERSFVPKLRVTSQERSDEVFTIKGEVDFGDIDTEEMDYKVMVKKKGGEWEEAVGRTRWAYAFDASDIDEGDVVEIKVLDGIKEPVISETVETKEENVGYLITVALVICIVIIIAILLFISTRGGKQEEVETKKKERDEEKNE